MYAPFLRVPDPRDRLLAHYDITTPEKIGSFSLRHTDTGEEVIEDSSLLRVLKLPERMDDVSFDLTDGYVPMSAGGANMGPKLYCVPRLSHTLQWILKNKNRLQAEFGDQPILGTDFVTTRRVLTHVMNTPYDRRFGDWVIGATKYKGVIYMYDFWSDEADYKDSSMSEASNLSFYTGHRFEYFRVSPYGRDPTTLALKMNATPVVPPLKSMLLQ